PEVGEFDSDWQVFGGGLMPPELGVEAVKEEDVDPWDREVLMDAMQPGIEDINWDEVNVDFARPFVMDTSLYSMDPTVSG
ncbi:hypothetical protein IMZ48_07000, partial [Candidatus Bathyarchaeota archaeon]|nr:hypothetical protein [Candidatus Bathyarchaeota archaeon]